MDVREKLVEFLGGCPCESDCEGMVGSCPNRKHGYCNEILKLSYCSVSKLAQHLVAHGVTVQERGQWIYDFNLAGSNFYRCSVCDRQETLLEKEDIYEYCPFCHCGAKMIPQPPKGE